MKCVFVIIALGLINSIESATWASRPDNPNPPGKCLLDNGVILDYGQNYKRTGKCEEIECLVGGQVISYGCGVKAVNDCFDDGYVDASKPFPECCERKFICDKNGLKKLMRV